MTSKKDAELTPEEKLDLSLEKVFDRPGIVGNDLLQQQMKKIGLAYIDILEQQPEYRKKGRTPLQEEHRVRIQLHLAQLNEEAKKTFLEYKAALEDYAGYMRDKISTMPGCTELERQEFMSAYMPKSPIMHSASAECMVGSVINCALSIFKNRSAYKVPDHFDPAYEMRGLAAIQKDIAVMAKAGAFDQEITVPRR